MCAPVSKEVKEALRRAWSLLARAGAVGAVREAWRGSRMSQRALFWRPVSISALPFTASTAFLNPMPVTLLGLSFLICGRSNITCLAGLF